MPPYSSFNMSGPFFGLFPLYYALKKRKQLSNELHRDIFFFPFTVIFFPVLLFGIKGWLFGVQELFVNAVADTTARRGSRNSIFKNDALPMWVLYYFLLYKCKRNNLNKYSSKLRYNKIQQTCEKSMLDKTYFCNNVITNNILKTK